MNNNSTKKIFLLFSFVFLMSWQSIAQVATVTTTGTPTAITSTSVTLDGNVTSIGGSPVTSRGTALKTSATVAATDNPVISGSGAGAFTTPRSGLTPGTQYFYVAFAVNGSGTALSGENSFYTLATPPLAQPGTFTGTGFGATQINLGFTAPNAGTVAASGYAIYRVAGSTPPAITGVNLPNGAAPPATIGTSTLVGTTAAATDVTFNDNTGISAATQYSYALIPFGFNVNNATYNYLIASYPTVTAYSLSIAATGQPASFTATPTGGTSINLAWPAGVTASGFLIYRHSGGTAPDVSGILNAAAPPASLGDGSTLVNTAAAGATSFLNNTGLSAGTQYSYALVPFGYNGSVAQTYNYLIAGAKTATATTFNGTSTITFNVGSTTPSIDYASFQTSGALTTGGGANSVSLAQFKLNDLGGDAAATALSTLTIQLTNFANINQIAIFDAAGTNLAQQAVSSNTVVFSGLSAITTADNSNVNFRIGATFKPIVTDQQRIDVTITGATSGAGSGFAAANAGGASTTIDATAQNIIQVNADRLSFNPISLINTFIGVNFGPLKVSAVDPNGNTEIGKNGTVTLSLNSGSGTINPGAQTLTPNLVSGTFTWTNLSVNLSGAKTILATYAGLTNANVNITIISPGVLVTAGTVPTMCYSGTFQTISAITIIERDPADFAAGASKSFSLVLPTDFIFDTSVTTTPSVTGNEISSPSGLTYTGNTIVRFTYSVSGTSNSTLDQIVINGLKVKYTGVVDATGNLLRFGGSADQLGNADTDGKNHATLNAVNSTSTVLDINVATAPGQPTVQPNDTRFLSSINTIQLVGSPSGGVFTGPGVSPNASLGYVFSPSAVGVSTGNVITYTYTEGTGQQCKVITTKLFDVYASVIINLANTYCTNAPPSLTLDVSPTDIAAQFGPNFALLDFVYVYSYTGNFFASTTYFYYLGTQSFAGSQSCNLFFGCSSSMSTFAGGTRIFNPSDPAYLAAQSAVGQVRVYYRAYNTTLPTDVRLGSVQFVTLSKPPDVNFALPKLDYCVTDASVTLAPIISTTPAPVNSATDNFTPPGGISNPTGNNWIFTPGNVPNATTSTQTITITYNYTDQASGCKNSFAIPNVKIHPIPTAPAAVTEVLDAISICQNGTPGTFTGNNGAIYSWYVNPALGLANQRTTSASTYTPSPADFNPANLGTTNFYVTKTLFGCESPSTTVSMTSVISPTITLNASVASCNTSPINISQGAVNAIYGGGATSATWSGGGGTFQDVSGNPLTAPFNLGNAAGFAVKYVPSAAEIAANNAALVVTTNQPNTCPAGTGKYKITINPTPPAPTAAKPLNTSGPLTEYCDGSINNNLVVNSTGTVTWYDNLSGSTPVNVLSTNNPFTFPFIVSAPNQDFYVTQTVAGCESAPTTVLVKIHPLPVVSYKVDSVCLGSHTQFKNLTLPPAGTPPYTLDNFEWRFGGGGTLDLGISSTNVNQTPVVDYPNIGTYSTQLIVTTNKGCSASSSQTVEIGPIPQTTFNFTQLCQGDVTQFTGAAGSQFDNTSPGRKIDKQTWTFGDPASGSSNTFVATGIGNNPTSPIATSHTYVNIGKYPTSLTLESKLFCKRTITTEVFLLPYINNLTTATSFPYSQNFDSGDGGWAGEGINRSDAQLTWKLGDPTGTKITANPGANSNAWYTTRPLTNSLGSTFDNNVRATLNGPCIDVTKLPRPVLSLKYFDDTDPGNDGAYVEVLKTPGGAWETLGTLNEGINWYDRNSISGLTQQNGVGQTIDQIGWSGVTSEWTEARFGLDNYSAFTKLRFRIVFGSNGDARLVDGFAIDDAELSSRNRTLLIETFTNENATRYAANNAGFKSAEISLEAAKIQYHTSFPASDSQSAANAADVSARAAFYGINSNPGGSSLIPRSLIDGFTEPTTNVADFSTVLLPNGLPNPNSWAKLLKSKRGLSVSPFKINITDNTVIGQPNLKIKIDITATSPVGATPRRNLSLVIAVVEKQVGNNTYLMRRLVPSPSGIPITTPMLKDATLSIPEQTIELSGIVNANQLAVVVFIQDLETSIVANSSAPNFPYVIKEVMQAAIKDVNAPALITAINDYPVSSISFYPVPADRDLQIRISEKAKSAMPLMVYDAMGKQIVESRIEEGHDTHTLHTQDWAGGVYIIQMESEKGMVRKKVMIVHER